MDLVSSLARCPLVAILRGVRPEEAEAIGAVLVEAGLLVIEVPLNSPEPMRSIEALAQRFGDRALIGAGTVRREAEVDAVAAAGGRFGRVGRPSSGRVTSPPARPTTSGPAAGDGAGRRR